MPATAPPVSKPTPLRFTVSDYHRMAEAGVLGADRHIELIDGHLYAMSPTGSQHAACVRRLNRFFSRSISPERALISIQNPVVLPPDSEPEPDVVLLKPRGDDYAAHHPRATDVLLVVEVADSSLTFDQEVKVPMYAHAGIPQVWVVALDEDCVHTYRDPDGGAYMSQHTYTHEETLSLSNSVDAPPLPVAAILGA